MYNTNRYKERTQSIVIDPNDIDRREETNRAKINMENGITPKIVCGSVKRLMKLMGADFYEMTGEDIARRVNIITSCSGLNNRYRYAGRTRAIA